MIKIALQLFIIKSNDIYPEIHKYIIDFQIFTTYERAEKEFSTLI